MRRFTMRRVGVGRGDETCDDLTLCAVTGRAEHHHVGRDEAASGNRVLLGAAFVDRRGYELRGSMTWRL